MVDEMRKLKEDLHFTGGLVVPEAGEEDGMD